MRWTTREEDDDEIIRAFLTRDRPWSAYLLADLEPPLRRDATFYLAARAGHDEALVMVYRPATFTALASMGAAEGVASVLSAIHLPAATGCGVPYDHRAYVDQHYVVAHWSLMERMWLPPGGFRVPPSLPAVEPLGPADAAAIAAVLQSREHVGYFTADMLTQGVYYGVWRDDQLIAVAGTHVMSPRSGVAAIGNVFTAPSARRQGFGLATTAAVIARLQADGIDQIVLNVSTENAAARRVYAQLGFVVTARYWETDEVRRRTGSGDGA